MLNKIIFFVCFSLTGLVSAQVGGEFTYQFLNLISSPRQAALGGKVLTNTDYDVVQPLYNPATISPSMRNQLAVNYTSYLGGVNYGTASYAHAFKEGKAPIHVGITYANYGAFDGYDENGISTGSFTGNDAALSLGYALQIKSSNFFVGANAKFVSSKLEQYSSFGAAADFAFLYRDDISSFTATLVARNLGSQITTYAEINERLPFEVAFGMSKILENVPIKWYLTLENLQQWPIAKPNPSRSVSDLEGNQTEEKIGFASHIVRRTIIGVELFPKGGFNIRLGYNFRRAEELRIVDQRNFSGLSTGLSIKMKKMRFSYAYARYASGANPHFFGLQIDLK